MGVGLLATMVALSRRASKVVIIGKTRDSIRDIYFNDIMEVIRRKFAVKWVLNKSEMVYTLRNGSTIKFVGVDADEDQMNKLLGQKFALAIVDEASMYANIDLRKFVYGILRPALADYNGHLLMIGTPSDYLDSLFYDVTTGAELGWETHEWTAFDNPYMKDQIAEEEAFIDATNPAYRETAMYRQHNLGIWVVNDANKIYKYDPKINAEREAPGPGYQMVLGVDLGYNDDTAFTVCAWSHYDPKLHIIHSEKHPNMILDDVEATIKALQARYGVHTIVVDGAAKQFVETLRSRFRIGLHYAEKIQKKDFIELMNADFYMGRITVVAENCKPLIEEWEALIWDEKVREKTGEWKEIRTKPNHAADSALYAWRWCHHYAAIPKTTPPTEEEAMETRILEQYNRSRDPEGFQGYDFDSRGF